MSYRFRLDKAMNGAAGELTLREGSISSELDTLLRETESTITVAWSGGDQVKTGTKNGLWNPSFEPQLASQAELPLTLSELSLFRLHTLETAALWNGLMQRRFRSRISHRQISMPTTHLILP